ncbi:hypothetical protein LI187_02035 [bacterium 210820-DFI.6.38]|nr:hypothetical protein [bacterium 210820-DFI.6.38]
MKKNNDTPKEQFICGMGGNLVYLEPWKERKVCGSGLIHHPVSSCGLYEKKEENSHEED